MIIDKVDQWVGLFILRRELLCSTIRRQEKMKVSIEGLCIHCDKPSTHVSLGIRFCTVCVQAMKNGEDMDKRTVWDE